jgi:hypothetical protein
MPAGPASNGTLHKYLRKTAAAGVGFRAIGAGIANATATRTLVTETLKYLDASWEDDIAIFRGYAGGQEALANMYTADSMRAAMFQFETNLINGGSSGFDGLAQQLPTVDGTHVISAGGSTALSSVYAIRFGEEDCKVILGNDGVFNAGDPSVQRRTDGTNPYDVLRCVIGGYGCLQIGSNYSVARLANIAAATQVLTDDLLSDLLVLFPVGKKPSVFVMNRRSHQQLQDSRTATNPTGAPAPFPTESFGIPIIVTDAISSAEAAIGATPTPTPTPT